MAYDEAELKRQAQQLLDLGISGAQAAFDDPDLTVDQAVVQASAALDKAWDALLPLPIDGFLMPLMKAWSKLMQEHVGFSMRMPWYQAHAANFHWRNGRAMMDAHRQDDAEEEFVKALAAYKAATGWTMAQGGNYFVTRLFEWRGICRAQQGKVAAAREDFLVQAQFTPAPNAKAGILHMISHADWQLGELMTALRRLMEALDLIDSDPKPDMGLRNRIERDLAEMRDQL